MKAVIISVTCRTSKDLMELTPIYLNISKYHISQHRVVGERYKPIADLQNHVCAKDARVNPINIAALLIDTFSGNFPGWIVLRISESKNKMTRKYEEKMQSAMAWYPSI